MFKQSKRKIVATIMALLVLILAGTIGIIYATTFQTVYKNNQELLADFTENYREGWQPELKLHDKGHSVTNSVVFYAVIFNIDHTTYQIINDLKPIVDDKTLTQLADKILKGGKMDGISGDFIYRVTRDKQYSYVTFMDYRIMKGSITALVENTTIFGGIALAIIFVVALKLADQIVSPLEESYKKQKQFISDAGHELKTPISTINTNSEMLEREMGKNQWLSNIKFENRRMQELVVQLLDLAKTENVSPIMERVDMSRLVMGGILPFESVAFEKGYTIESDIAENIAVMGDKNQLGQLVATLMDNALSHAEGEGVISITLKTVRHMTVLSISNPGKEIPLAKREQIFERFYRTDDSRSLNGHYGLGLAIAKAIMTAHNGRLSVSWNTGITTFTAEIPQKK